jgi:prepilin-type N-terminal cleavage/methylation domain-containing protein
MEPGTSRRAHAHGFTLIEVLLAVGITSIVMLAVGTTFRVTLEARDVIDELAESTAAGPRILAMIERDLRGLWTYDIKQNRVLVGRNRDVGSFEADRIDMLTTTDSVGFVLDDHNVPHQTTVCEVGYWLKPNARYRDLIELWRREDPMIDGDILTEGRFQLVHDRIKSFKITYFRELGYSSEELHEWDSGIEDTLPRRIKIEITLERNRSSRNIVDDAEVEDFEGAEKTYVRHIVLDPRLMDSLQPDVAMIPVRPSKPDSAAGGGGGPAGEGGGGGPSGSKLDGAGRDINIAVGRDGMRMDGARGGDRGGRGARGGTRQGGGGPPGIPNGFNLGDLLRGSRGGGGLFGGGGSNGQSGGGRR